MSAYEGTSGKKRKKRRKSRPFLWLFIFILLIAGVVMVLRSSLFNITSILVEGNKFYTPSQVIELSGVETGKNLIFDVKSRAVRNRLLESPYIITANVEKIPMGTVVIKIDERVEYATVADGERIIIIDREGTVLRITDTAPEITVLEGMEIAEAVEGKPLKAQQTYMLTGTLKIMAATEEMDLYFKKIFFSSAVVRAYIYDKYYCEGTPDGILANLKAIKELVTSHYMQDINKGVIKVGTGGELFFDPKID